MRGLGSLIGALRCGEVGSESSFDCAEHCNRVLMEPILQVGLIILLALLPSQLLLRHYRASLRRLAETIAPISNF